MSDIPAVKKSEQFVEDAADAMRGAASRAGDVAESQVAKARAAVSKAADDVADKATGAARGASSAVSDVVDQAARSAQKLADGVTETVQNYPIRTVLIAAAAAAVAGLVLGYLFSRRD